MTKISKVRAHPRIGTKGVTAHTRELQDNRVPHNNSDLSVRALHQLRSVDDRIADEKTTEKVVDKKKWITNPEKYDYSNVDTAIPDGFTIEQHGDTLIVTADPEDPDYTEEQAEDDLMEGEDRDDIHRSLGGTAGYLRFYDHSSAGYIHIDAINIYSAFRGEGLSNVMLRALNNFADKKNLDISLVAQPFEIAGFMQDPDVMDYDPYIPEKYEVEDLVKYYEQFGFKRKGKMSVDDDTYSQKMSRKPQKGN